MTDDPDFSAAAFDLARRMARTGRRGFEVVERALYRAQDAGDKGREALLRAAFARFGDAVPEFVTPEEFIDDGWKIGIRKAQILAGNSDSPFSPSPQG